MAYQINVVHVREEIRQVLEKVGKALNEWLTKQGLTPRPVPIPINHPNHSPHRKKRKVV
jgi:hypothetical protein